MKPSLVKVINGLIWSHFKCQRLLLILILHRCAYLVATDSRSAFAFLPAVAVGRRRGSLQLAVVAFVTGTCTLGAAAQRVGQTTCSTFKDILKKNTNSDVPKSSEILMLKKKHRLWFFCQIPSHTWLMCSAPVHVKLQVSLQHSTWSGELSAFELFGKIIDINVFFCVSGSSDDSLATRWAASNRTKAAG